MHDKVRRFIHVRMNFPKRFSKGVSKPAPKIASTNKRWIPDDEFCRRPVRPSRIRVGLLAIDDFRHRFAVPRQDSVLHQHVLERAQDWLFWRRALSAEVPL